MALWARDQRTVSAFISCPDSAAHTTHQPGSSTNLAPFSYFNVINHDPPLFIIGFAGGMHQAKDSLANLRDSGECTLNIISEHYVEAANAASINAPFGISEWALTGLHPAPCAVVQASRVKEAVFSVEAKLHKTEEFESRATPGKKTGVLAIVEGVRFWAREDALDEQQSLLDPQVSCPGLLFAHGFCFLALWCTDIIRPYRSCALFPGWVVSRTAALSRLLNCLDRTLSRSSRLTMRRSLSCPRPRGSDASSRFT